MPNCGDEVEYTLANRDKFSYDMEFKKKKHSLKIFSALEPGKYDIDLVGKIKVSPSSLVE